MSHDVDFEPLSGDGATVRAGEWTADLRRLSAVPVDLEMGLDSRLPEPVEVAAYYVVSEALTNVGGRDPGAARGLGRDA